MDDGTKKLLESLNKWAPGINNKNSNPYVVRSKRQFGTLSPNYVVIDIEGEKYYVPESTFKRMARAVCHKLKFIHDFNEKTNEVQWLELKTVLSKKEEAFLLRYYDQELNGTIRIANTMLIIHHDGSTFHLRFKFETLFYCVDGACLASAEMVVYAGKIFLHLNPHHLHSPYVHALKPPNMNTKVTSIPTISIDEFINQLEKKSDVFHVLQRDSQGVITAIADDDSKCCFRFNVQNNGGSEKWVCSKHGPKELQECKRWCNIKKDSDGNFIVKFGSVNNNKVCSK